MKKLIIFFFLSTFFSLSAHALTQRSLAYVCDRISSSTQTTACFAAANGQAVDQWALGACDRLSSSRQTVACVEAIAGKVYDYDAVRACDRISSGNETINCLNAAGRVRSRIPRLRRMLERAQRQYDNGNYNRLGNTLRRMQEVLN